MSMIASERYSGRPSAAATAQEDGVLQPLAGDCPPALCTVNGVVSRSELKSAVPWPATRVPPAVPLTRKLKLRRAVLLSFRDPLTKDCLILRTMSKREWHQLLHWMDVSGLALYFLDRLGALQMTHTIPAWVLARLRQNMRDNIARTHGMIAESVAIQEEFQTFAIPYAVLKGFSLSPESVPMPEQRHQFDLDFMVAEEASMGARAALERHGYRLYAVSGKSWEFKKEEKIGISMEDFYKDDSGRTVELHLQRREEEVDCTFSRVKVREFCGIDMPVLSSVDLFIGQGMHVFKHICGEFSRAAHLLEFYRHIKTRLQDQDFWSDASHYDCAWEVCAQRADGVDCRYTSFIDSFVGGNPRVSRGVL